MGGVVSSVKKLAGSFGGNSGIAGALKKVADPGDIFGWNPNSPFGAKQNLPDVAANPKAGLAAANTEGQQLLKDYQTGTLSGGQKAVVDSYKASANAKLQQELGKAGQSDSSAAAVSSGAIDAQAAVMTQQFLNEDLQSSMDLMGMNLNAYYQTEALDIQQNEGTAGALGQVGASIAAIFA